MTAVMAQAGSGPSNLWRPHEPSILPTGSGEFDPGPAFWLSGQAMLLVDARRTEHSIILANDAFQRLTGYSGDEVVGKDGGFLFGPEADSEPVRWLPTAFENGTGLDIELLVYRKDGAPFWSSLAVRPVPSRSADTLYALASFTDIGPIRELERKSALAKAAHDEATARLIDLESELDRERILLRDADHRIKNSLQMASSLVLLNARRAGDDGARRVLQNLAERIAALSNAHRMLERVGNIVRLDMGSLVSELAAELSHLVPTGQVDVETNIEPTMVAASRGAPLALLMNEVIGNAFKHAFPDDRKGRLRLALSRSDEHVRCMVEDDGVGLPAGSLPEGGFGRILIDVLARQLRARLEWHDAGPGTRVTIILPLDAEELLF